MNSLIEMVVANGRRLYRCSLEIKAWFHSELRLVERPKQRLCKSFNWTSAYQLWWAGIIDFI